MAPPPHPRRAALLCSALLALALHACAGTTTQRAPAATDEGVLERYAATLRFTLGQPRSLAVTPQGEVLFLRSPGDSFVQSLYVLDPKSGQERVLLDAGALLGGKSEVLTPEEQARRERARQAQRGLVSYELSRDGSTILTSLSGRLYTFTPATGAVRELPTGEGPAEEARLSPDAGSVAFTRGGELWTLALNTENAAPARLTTDASGGVTSGSAEFVAQEEMDRREGYWWSPDSSKLLYQRTDTSGVETFYIADPSRPEVPPQSWPYPRSGRANAEVRLGIIPAAGGETTWIEWDRGAYPYVARVAWPRHAPPCVLVQNREQTRQLLLRVDEASGATSTILTEEDPAWLNLFSETPAWLEDGSRFVWISERSGDARLELRAADGGLIAELTPPGFGLLSLAGVGGGDAFVVASSDPTQRHVWRVPLDPSRGGPQKLSSQPGHHALALSENGEFFAQSSQSAKGDMSWSLRRASDGKTIAGVKSSAQEPPFLPAPELREVTAGGRVFNTAVLRPRDRSSGDKSKLPVIVWVYAGPHARTVNATPRGYLVQQWMADQGFIVVAIDGRGTPQRGREWERAIKGNLIDVALEDQAAALKALGDEVPEMDMTRVGIFGWSFGGYFSAMAACRRGDLYHAAAAGAPVVDWRDYDTHYTERYMGLPEKNKAGYDASSVLTYAKDLKVPLLLIHGTADDNVYFLNSLRLTAELNARRLPYEFLPLPGNTHMLSDPATVRLVYSRIAEFFKDTLR